MDRHNSRQHGVNPRMITLARESRGLSQQQLAAELGLVQGSVSKFESGLLPLQSDLLESLTRILHYPAEFFYQEGPILGPGIPEFYHRKRSDVPKKTLDQVYAQMNIRRLQVAALLKAVDIPCKIPQFDPEDYNGDIEEIARLVRAHLLIPRGPIQDVTMTLEDAGVLLLPFDFGTGRIDAISQWVPGLVPLIFVNQETPRDRYRYSLAHELGHMVMHATPNPEIEQQADRFAAEFLTPAREVKADLMQLTVEKLARLKPYWKVSMAMLLKRAGDLGTITPNQSRYLWTLMARSGYKTREPIHLDIKGEQPCLLHEMIDTYLQDLGYTPSDLGKVVNLFDDEFRPQYLRPSTHPSGLRVVPDPVPVRRRANRA